MAKTGPKLALLTNPLSGHNRRHGDAVVALAEREGVVHVEGREPVEIEAALLVLAKQQPDLLIVSGGDGTVAAVVSILRKQRIFEREPILALLRGGSTNMIQNDAGLGGKPLAALKRLLRVVRDDIPEENIRSRSPLKIQREKDDFEEYGFFWSAGALPRVFRSTQTGYAQGGVRGSRGEFGALLGSLRSLLKGDLSQDEIIYPEPIGWQPVSSPPSRSIEISPRLFVFVTTLDRLILGLSPGSDADGLKVVSLKYPFVRRDLFTYLRKRGNAKEQTTKSFDFESAQALSFDLSSDWALDGEFFEGDTSLQLSMAAPFRFLIC